jgi:hypothetical protein
MAKAGQPLFLARRAYRRRRLMDAARLLPLLGAVLFAIPMLWHPADSVEPDTARGVTYLFAVWFLLILAAAALSRGLRPTLEDDSAEERPEGPL